MSVDNTTPINVYNTNGITTGFAFDFKILDASDLSMMFNQGALPAFSISGVGDDDGGEVLFVTPPVIGQLVLYRQLSLVRTTDYQYQGSLPAKVVNADLDRLVMMVQQVNRDLARSIKLPITETNDQLLNYTPAQRANTVIAFDATGNIVVSTTDAANVIAAQAAAAAAIAAAASINPTDIVHITGAETIIGAKTFSDISVPDQVAGTNNAKAANTKFVIARTPDATEVIKGLLQLATAAEATAGSINGKAVHPAGLLAALNALVFGRGQAWTDVVGARSLNTLFTNTTNRTIYVGVAVTGSASSDLEAITSATRVSLDRDQSSADYRSVSFPVLPGATYRVNFPGTLLLWVELR